LFKATEIQFNARIQFSFRPNVQIFQYAFEVLENFEQEMAIDGSGPSIRYRRQAHILDLSIFSPERILKNQPLSETGIY